MSKNEATPSGGEGGNLARTRAVVTMHLGETLNSYGLAVERSVRSEIAYRIRAELVCCDVYDQFGGDFNGYVGLDSSDLHTICFWGEAAARIAENAQE